MPAPTISPLQPLLDLALACGASAAVVISSTAISVRPQFAELCAAPHRCPSYGLAPGCPPHAMQPTQFKEELSRHRHVLVFKIDVPAADLLGEKRLSIARAIHRIAAHLERTAREQGISHARSWAAGSCKELFCADEATCAVLTAHQPCRYPDLARGSISAVGVDFSALASRCGWACKKIESTTTPTGEPVMALMAGLVLLD